MIDRLQPAYVQVRIARSVAEEETALRNLVGGR